MQRSWRVRFLMRGTSIGVSARRFMVTERVRRRPRGRLRAGRCWQDVPDSGGWTQRCPGQLNWAGIFATRQRRWRVRSCDEHLDGGTNWITRPG